MSETLSTLSIIAFAVAALCLVLAVFFFFFFNIPAVIGDLTGRTAKKSIAKMRAANEKAGSKSYRASPQNVARGKVTDTMPDSGKLKKKKGVPADRTADTAPRSSEETALLGSEETALLGSEETALLGSEETTLLGSDETALLSNDETALLSNDETALLVETNETSSPAKAPARPGGVKLEMIESIMLVHTNETIDS